jgi:hypothetical protein
MSTDKFSFDSVSYEDIVNKDKIHDQDYIFCTICLQLMADPAETECGHLFCYECLAVSLQANHNCPTCSFKNCNYSKSASRRRDIMNLIIKCPKGQCNTQVQLKELESHFDVGCKFGNQLCIWCKNKFPYDKVENHMVYCPEADHKCQYCEKTYKSYQESEHYDVCEGMYYLCELCNNDVLRRNLADHQVNDCTFSDKICKICNVKFTYDTIDHHEKYCDMKPVECDFCFQKLKYEQQYEHYDVCPAMLFTCDICNNDIARQNKAQHEIECRKLNILTCKWCNTNYKKELNGDHTN